MLADFFVGLKIAIQARGFTGPVQLGRKYLAGQDDPTAGRVVCVLARDPVTPTTRIGGNPRSRITRMGAFEIHVWGQVSIDGNGLVDDVQSLRNAENLVQLVINGIRDNATGTSTIEAVDWSQSVETPIMRAGYMAIVTMTVEIPMVDTTYPNAPAPPNQPIPNVYDHFTLNGAPATGPTCGTP